MPDFKNMKDEIVLYQPNDQLSLEVKVENDTVWLNRNQMAVLFDRDVKTIGKHINNALQEELAPVVAKNAPTQNGTQAVAKNATPYENQVVAKFATPYEHGSHKGQILTQRRLICSTYVQRELPPISIPMVNIRTCVICTMPVRVSNRLIHISGPNPRMTVG